MELRKPSDFFGKKSEESNLPVVESDISLHEELTKVEILSDQINQLQQELTQKVVKTDLENLVISQINTMRENFDYLQNDFKKSNKKDISEFKERALKLTEIVENLVEYEIPKYKKQVTKNEIYVSEEVNNVKEIVEQNITNIRDEIDSKFDNIVDALDNNIEYFNEKLNETSTQVKETKKIYTNISKTLETRVSQENEQFEEYSQIIENLYKQFDELSSFLREELSTNEQHISNVDKYLKEHHQELLDLKVEVFHEIKKLPVGNIQENIKRLENKIDYIKETYSKIEPEVIVKEVIKEGLLNEPPETKNIDPLTPLNQNFVTLDQLQQHYKLFINRIQQQLSTLGGGGETKLKYLDDIVGIATNASAYDNKFLKYNHSIGKFEFVTVSGGGGSQTLDNTLQLGNTSSLGMSVGVITATEFVGPLTGNASSATYATTADTANSSNYASASTTATYAGYANSSGIATYATTAGIATYAITAGIATYSTSSGIATYSTSSGIATYANTAGIATYANTAGIATYSTSSGIATALQNVRTFEITGDVVASGINFDGTGNVSFAATIQPNSVALGSDTTGDYVQSISGTANQIVVTGGTGESSTPVLSFPSNLVVPQDLKVTRDLQVDRNLNVTGNITIGGTTAFVNVQELSITDPDIVLGFRTDAFGNDISNDNTANHGGVALASTEGTPLVSLYDISIGETNPTTYKKIMWFKEGSFTGLGTDAWLINYAVGIGSTQFPIGTRLAAGSVQFTERDLAVVRNINATGVVTATSFIGNASSATYANTAGIATYADTAGISTYSTSSGIATYADTAGISTYSTSSGIATYADTAGISTYATTAGIATVAQGLTGTPNLNVGIVTATAFVGDGSGLTGIVFPGIDIQDEGSPVGTATTINFVGDSVTATFSSGIATVTVSGTGGASTNLGVVLASTYNMLMP